MEYKYINIIAKLLLFTLVFFSVTQLFPNNRIESNQSQSYSLYQLNDDFWYAYRNSCDFVGREALLYHNCKSEIEADLFTQNIAVYTTAFMLFLNFQRAIRKYNPIKYGMSNPYLENIDFYIFYNKNKSRIFIGGIILKSF